MYSVGSLKGKPFCGPLNTGSICCSVIHILDTHQWFILLCSVTQVVLYICSYKYWRSSEKGQIATLCFEDGDAGSRGCEEPATGNWPAVLMLFRYPSDWCLFRTALPFIFALPSKRNRHTLSHKLNFYACRKLNAESQTCLIGSVYRLGL